MNLQNPSRYVYLSWIAQRWGISLSSVLRNHVGPGKLLTRRHGRGLLVSLDDLSRYEARLRVALRTRRKEQVEKIEDMLAAIEKPLPLIGT